jgi:hypothetical protein
MIALLPLLLGATPVSGGDGKVASSRVARVATATVTIIQAERITPSVVETNVKPDRQIRRREQKPLVEFF